MKAATYFAIVGGVTCAALGGLLAASPRVHVPAGEALGVVDRVSSAPDSFHALRVQPIFDEYCIACHGPGKAKGDLRVDTLRQLSFGGEEGRAVAPGAPEASPILTRVRLPQSDKRTMPPAGRSRLSQEEETVMALWIERGASGALGPEWFEDAPGAVEVAFPTVDAQALARDRAIVEPLLAALPEALRGATSFEARTSADLAIIDAGLAAPIDDAAFARLRELAPFVRRLDLSRATITDQSADILAAMTRLETARLAGTNLSAQSLERLADAPALASLTARADQIAPDLRAALGERGVRVYRIED